MTDLAEELWSKTCLVLSLAIGELSVEEFEKRYSNFYWEYPLHGMEGDESTGTKQELEQYNWLINIHKRIQDEVFTWSTSEGRILRQPATAPVDEIRRILKEEELCNRLAAKAAFRDS